MRKILHYCLLPFLYVYIWIKCVVFKKHKIIKGCIWNSDYKRMDTCKHCGKIIITYDKTGYDMRYHLINIISETRKVLVEKTETPVQILINQLKKDSIRKRIMEKPELKGLRDEW